MYFSDFLWSDYCFQERHPLVCAQRITEVIVSGMEPYIPHTFSTPHAKKIWFNPACSRTIKDREEAHKRFDNLQTQANHNLYISTRNRHKSIFQLAKNSFIHSKCQHLASSNSSRNFWHLAKNISNFTSSSSPLFLTQMATIPSHLSLRLNSSLKLSVTTPLRMDDSEHIPPTHSSSDSFMPVIKILKNDVFYAL